MKTDGKATYYKFKYIGAVRKSFVLMEADKEQIHKEIHRKWNVNIHHDDIEIISEEEYKRVLPCPFCEGVARLVVEDSTDGVKLYSYLCSVCCDGIFDFEESEEEARELWNEWAGLEE